MAIELPHKLFTVDEFHRMAEAGILSEDDRVELIEGEIVEMAPIRMRHAMCVARLVELLTESVRRRAIVWPQNSVILNDGTELQPDVALLRLRHYSEDELAPGADDIIFVVEVSDSTLSKDRLVKAPHYARAAIAEFWLINLQESVIEVYATPSSGAYQQMKRVERGASLQVPGLTDIRLNVNDILG